MYFYKFEKILEFFLTRSFKTSMLLLLNLTCICQNVPDSVKFCHLFHFQWCFLVWEISSYFISIIIKHPLPPIAYVIWEACTCVQTKGKILVWKKMDHHIILLLTIYGGSQCGPYLVLADIVSQSLLLTSCTTC